MVAQKNPTKRSRRSIRLKEFDYSQPGSYFVTIVTHEWRCLLGNILEGQITLSSSGIIVGEILQGISERFPNVTVDMFVVMPNHLHVILNVGAQFIAPAGEVGRSKGAMNRAPTLGQIIRTVKAVSTQRIRRTSDSRFAWQSNYYEHVVRDEESLNRIRQYILDNPLKWGLDPENPEAISPEATDTWRVP